MSGRRIAAAGFTLIELLIAISIFAVVISSVYGAYRATFQTVNSTEAQVRLETSARVILERIGDDLETIALDRQGKLVGIRGDVGGKRGDSLEVVAYAHLPFDRGQAAGGRTTLTYTAKENDEGLIDLYRKDRPRIPGEEEEDPAGGELLGRGLLEFSLSYVDDQGGESEEWRTDEPNFFASGAQQSQAIRLPVLIRVTIRLASDPEDETGTLFRTAVALPRLDSGQGQG